jgi:hypothetical protein
MPYLLKKVREAEVLANGLVQSPNIPTGFFHTVILDDWRGIRLIFDSESSRNCKNDCESCRQWTILGKEDTGKEDNSILTTILEWEEDKDKFLLAPNAVSRVSPLSAMRSALFVVFCAISSMTIMGKLKQD